MKATLVLVSIVYIYTILLFVAAVVSFFLHLATLFMKDFSYQTSYKAYNDTLKMCLLAWPKYMDSLDGRTETKQFVVSTIINLHANGVTWMQVTSNSQFVYRIDYSL